MSAPLRRVLVANRGEIAVRICRALRESGIDSVAVHSDVDARAPHVFAASHTVSLGGAAPADSYLRGDLIVEAARSSGADAVHPGYGFLSEDPAFARAVEDAGLTFIGPDSRAIALMGSKKKAREIARAAGVPVIPGFDGDNGDDAELDRVGRELGIPLIVKAVAGGGGKGMRVVGRESDLAEAIRACRREARAAFGDDRLLVERLVLPARHIEIQVFGDLHGNVISLNERECSVQRRHQKILEEAPSPAVDAALRRRMGDTAVALAKEIGYRNAGTVEFLLGEDGQFYFLEMNTRLQVEHPVTEFVTGLDLVRLQLQVAAGETLEALLAGVDLRPRGHAIEARIYAESPGEGFLPAAGHLAMVVEPRGPGIRVDSGVHRGVDVGTHYDPLLAKLIVHAPDRTAACDRMALALSDCTYLGIPTNVDFLGRVVDDAAFRAGDLRTDFLDCRPDLAGYREATPDLAFIAGAMCQVIGRRSASTEADAGRSRASTGPWDALRGLRIGRRG